MSLRALDWTEAQAWFDAMPLELQLVSLSPAFAQADVARQDGLGCRHLGFEAGGQRWLHTVHLKPLAASGTALAAISPYGYGGPLSSSADARFLAQAWAAYGAWCVSQQVLAEFCRFHPEAANQRFFGGTVSENRQTVSVDLSDTHSVLSFNDLARRKVRRALSRGARVRWSRDADDWARYGQFYRTAMQAMNAVPWYLFGNAYFAALSKLPQATLCLCESDGDWWSAGVFLLGPQVVEYHLGASSAAGHEAGTPYLLQQAAAQEGQLRGARALYLGGGTSPEVDNPLLFYKKSFSKRLLPFYIGQVIHDQDAYWALAATLGHDREHPPARILLD